MIAKLALIATVEVAPGKKDQLVVPPLPVRLPRVKSGKERQMQWLTRYLGFVRKLVQTFGPYLLVEILLPGGSLIALALFVYQQQRLPFAREVLTPAIAWISQTVMRRGENIFSVASLMAHRARCPKSVP
jgi:hypothetical protein